VFGIESKISPQMLGAGQPSSPPKVGTQARL